MRTPRQARDSASARCGLSGRVFLTHCKMVDAHCPCDTSRLSCRLASILSYDCVLLDSLLNWAAIVLTTLGGSLLLRPWQCTGRPHTGTAHYAFATAFYMAFQLGLCLSLYDEPGCECTGVSIVWSAQIGHLWYQRFRERSFSPGRRWALACLTGVAAALWAYYGFTSPVLTSIAHLAAVVMGWLVAWSLRYGCGGGGARSEAEVESDGRQPLSRLVASSCRDTE